MTFKVDVYVDEVWVKTYYDVPGDDESQAQEYVQENIALDFSVEQND